MTTWLKRIWLLSFVLLLVGCENTDVTVESQGASAGAGPLVVEAVPVDDLVRTIQRQSDMTFFAQGLASTQLNLFFSDLRRSYTLVVPTDSAIDTLDEARRIELLTDQSQMRAFIQRHASAVVRSDSELQAGLISMLNGEDRGFTPGLFERPNIQATNGVVHGINTVLDAPERAAESLTVGEVISTDSRFQGLAAAFNVTGLSSVLNQADANLTLFAPTNSAFFTLGATRVQALYADLPQLENLLRYHLISGAQLDADDFGGPEGVLIPASNSDELSLSQANGQLLVDGVVVELAPITTSNGVIYVIETVLEP